MIRCFSFYKCFFCAVIIPTCSVTKSSYYIPMEAIQMYTDVTEGIAIMFSV